MDKKFMQQVAVAVIAGLIIHYITKQEGKK